MSIKRQNKELPERKIGENKTKMDWSLIITVDLESRMGEMIFVQFIDYNDSTYMISFTAQQKLEK